MVSADFTKYITEDLNRPLDDTRPLLEEVGEQRGMGGQGKKERDEKQHGALEWKREVIVKIVMKGGLGQCQEKCMHLMSVCSNVYC